MVREKKNLLWSNAVHKAVYAKIQGEKLQQAIAALPEIQRRRFLLCYEYALTYEEITEKEGCTKMPVKRSVDRAVKKIKNKIF